MVTVWIFHTVFSSDSFFSNYCVTVKFMTWKSVDELVFVFDKQKMFHYWEPKIAAHASLSFYDILVWNVCNTKYNNYLLKVHFNFADAGSGATCMAHVDGADQESGITPLISRIQEVSLGYPNGRIELHLVGGYMDPRGYSERLVINLLRKLH